ncbi:uncharacterized protein PHACADRAFT_250716 [Phanerochaete carnosa HHB-10118-sp]|uniref:NADAR domain-containing protein n=1 Tax=Phanerochaete carnosa (strain HHB-10118-sp) TaxID=650164 RepID=K5VAN3_PHACS|nr:uncharacterized protein PHACADRAFT_250716 [Phanerochaete carnosa HHB-10118-sp]EKM59916.1 hypothetical protein PHACADRAFT_250716 [Phanerochaete carnosa HHB-10118-sp]
MNFAHPAPSAYPVIPPMPVPTHPVVVPNAAPMPQPMMQMPMPQPMPTAMPPTTSAPVIPPVPQTGTGTPYPMAPEPPVIPAMAAVYPPPLRYDDRSSSYDSSSSSDLGDMQPGPSLPPRQSGLRSFVFERPQSIVFHHHPLPSPPVDIFEHSPNMRLLEDLRRPVEEVLAKSKVSPTGYVITPVGTRASHEKKKRKGLFRAFGEKLSGKSKREHEQPQMTQMAIPVVYAAAPALVQPQIRPGVVPSPGYVYDPAHASSGIIPPQVGFIPGTAPTPMFAMPASGTPAPPPPLPPKGPASPSPSHAYSPRPHSPRSHSPRAHSPRPYSPRPYSPRSHSPRHSHEPLRIDLLGSFTELTHISPHDVLFNNRLYPTVLHALEAQRFEGIRPDIVDEIAACHTPDDVRVVVSRSSDFSRPDWEQVVVQMMDEVLFHKFKQHPHLQQILLGTGDLSLQFFAQQDNFWGDGPLGQGANHLGKALERVRERLRNERYP